MNTRNVDKEQDQSLMEIHEDIFSTEEVNRLGERLRERVAQLGISQVEAARRCGLSPSRFGNYYKNSRSPDLDTLMRMARALQTSTDWLLGFSAVEPADVAGIVGRLLELEGLPPARAAAIAETAQEALRVLAALSDEGDARSRSRIAAQAAWQLTGDTRPVR